MKRKYALISSVFTWAVLTAMLIQSVHSFHHLEEEFSKRKCHHEHTNNKAELTHSHELEHCFVCEFVFFNSTEQSSFSLNWFTIKNNVKKPVLFLTSTPLFFKGSLFALRGPPLV